MTFAHAEALNVLPGDQQSLQHVGMAGLHSIVPVGSISIAATDSVTADIMCCQTLQAVCRMSARPNPMQFCLL